MDGLGEGITTAGLGQEPSVDGVQAGLLMEVEAGGRELEIRWFSDLYGAMRWHGPISWAVVERCSCGLEPSKPVCTDNDSIFHSSYMAHHVGRTCHVN